jgi:hypothetical protein
LLGLNRFLYILYKMRWARIVILMKLIEEIHTKVNQVLGLTSLNLSSAKYRVRDESSQVRTKGVMAC